MKDPLIKYQRYAPFILRMGLGLVFLVFGVDKIFRPDYWIGWIPNWFIIFIPFDVNYFIYFQGIIEAVVGLLLILGLFIRLASLISVLIMGSIIIILFFNPSAISHFSDLHIDKDIFPLILNGTLLRDLGLLSIVEAMFYLWRIR